MSALQSLTFLVRSTIRHYRQRCRQRLTELSQGSPASVTFPRTESRESDTFKAWGGDTVLTSQTDYSDTFNFKLLEVLKKEVLETVFGAGNVSGTLATGLTVNANSKELPSCAWVIDMIMRDDTLNRVVIPNGKISEIGDIVYSSSDLTAYDVTVTAFPDTNGNTHYEYKKSAPVVS